MGCEKCLLKPGQQQAEHNAQGNVEHGDEPVSRLPYSIVALGNGAPEELACLPLPFSTRFDSQF